jgi:TIR domain/SIR2-like domain
MINIYAMAVNMIDPTWDMLIQKINDGSCILVLGPNVALSDPEKSMNLMLKNYLSDLYPDGIKHYQEDEFFSFSDPGDKETAIFRIQNFFKDLQPSDVYSKIAEIPFRLIISVSPDHLLKNVFEAKKINHTFDFYNKEQNPGPIEKPSSDKPLIYNLFGDIDSEGSLVFTYDDLFDYLIKIFSEFKLPPTLQNELKLVRHVLFLGFDFEKWYFKLLLRVLKLNEIKVKNASKLDKRVHPHLVDFYQDEFKMKFMEYSEMEILDTIYAKCAEKGVLRSKAKPLFAGNVKIYISYAWKGESEETADSIEHALKEKGISIIRDKKDLGYTGDIKGFMSTIGKGDYVIVIISDKYLRSENCMFELLEINKNGDFAGRIFPIVLSDANIYDDIVRIDYLNYWTKKIKDLNEKVSTMEDKMGTNNIITKLNLFGDIRRFFDEITGTLSYMNALTPEMHKESDFSAIVDAIEKKLKQD